MQSQTLAGYKFRRVPSFLVSSLLLLTSIISIHPPILYPPILNMVALQPRFLVLLGLCVAASSSALSVPPADAPAAPATVHGSVHVPRSTPDVALPAKVPHVARNTPDLPKVIPSKMIKRAGPPKLPTPAMPKLPVPNHLRSVPELPAKLPVSKKDLRSVPAPALPKLPSDKPSAPNPPKVPAKLPQSLKRDEPPAVPKLPLPVPLPVPAPNSAAMIPPPKRSHDAPNANLPQPHLLVDRPRVSRDMSTGSIDTVLAALTDDEEDGHQKRYAQRWLQVRRLYCTCR
ncbi:hypothetical protein C8R43DRAFT_238917 [Mycena crocata]|nr:hypothetical protein C8R43DRAFT_238917 [Mycena crocata]